MMNGRTQQEYGALILRSQLDAARLVRLANEAEATGATVITIAVEDAREIARRMTDVSAIAEQAHLGLYGVAAQQVAPVGGRRV